MRVQIKKISIKRFRSFGQVEIEAAKLNVYSGKNNAGKSNILRALNLFFNSESNYNTPFNHQVDYNKAYRGAAGGKRAVEITLDFAGDGDGALKDDFSISRTFSEGLIDPETRYMSTNPEVQKAIDDHNGTITRQFTAFLNKIAYLYVPAVRDKVFVKSLLLKFEQVIKTTANGEKFGEAIDELSTILSEASIGVSNNLQQYLHLPAIASLSSNITDVLGAIEINVDSGLQVQDKRAKDGKRRIRSVPVNLFSSGDGVVMAYLVYFLAFLTEKGDKHYIWGFEEPENSLEYSKVEDLAKQFYQKFSKLAQVFVTTHSPAFINLREYDDVLLYRVYIEPQSPEDRERGTPNKCLTRVEKLDDIRKRMLALDLDDPRYSILDEELHLAEQSRAIEEMACSVRQERERLAEEEEKFRKKNKELLASFPGKIFICEDENGIKLWQHLFLETGITDVAVIPSDGCSNNQIEIWASRQKKIKTDYNPKIFRSIDRDGMIDDQVEIVKSQAVDKFAKDFAYAFEPLPVYEVENFALLCAGNRAKLPSTYYEIETERAVAISDHFQDVARNKIHGMSKLVENVELFPPASAVVSSNKLIEKMRDAAVRDFIHLMPGKELAKVIDNFASCSFLQRMKFDNFPEELKSYLSKVQDFFQ